MESPTDVNSDPLRFDLIVHPDWIIPVAPRGQVLADHSLCVANGAIAAIIPTDQARAMAADEHLELPDHVLIPGLINGHGHAAMSLLRGFADDYPLMQWLQEHIWPAEAAFVSEQFVKDGSDLAIAELILGGATTFSDMYFYPEITAERVELAGLRAQLCFPIMDIATGWASGPEQCLNKGLELRDRYIEHDRIEIGFGPHSTYTLNEASLQQVATLANELDAPLQIHLHETRGEVQVALEATGDRPIAQLARHGMLGPRTQCVHMKDVIDEDIQLLNANGSHVIHCPRSNMKLANRSRWALKCNHWLSVFESACH